ncbi:hypothetical protein CHS0354_033307 [Potamilus streckersoni]|uniref:Uncharacterized protein n=1 Tax=Potamilus streckersoni TaxID=2493646 RepID=A0AAE0RTB9_9BIVA|nr:hypothetical protein CHS0354_033307 [Potamilus streckersoni]
MEMVLENNNSATSGWPQLGSELVTVFELTSIRVNLDRSIIIFIALYGLGTVVTSFAIVSKSADKVLQRFALPAQKQSDKGNSWFKNNKEPCEESHGGESDENKVYIGEGQNGKAEKSNGH